MLLHSSGRTMLLACIRAGVVSAVSAGRSSAARLLHARSSYAAAAVSPSSSSAASSSAASSSAAASSSSPSAAATPSRSTVVVPRVPTAPSDLYRSPLRMPDDRTYDHLWQNMWTLDAKNQRYTVIWLHGLGQTTKTLHTMCDILAPQYAKFVVPQAPKIGLSCLPDDPDQECWFDLLSERRDAAKEARGETYEEDQAGIDEVRNCGMAGGNDEQMAMRVHELIEHEISVSGLPSTRILLAGFGEGGALALHSALSFPRPLAGVVSLAGYLPLPHLYPDLLHPAQRQTPILAVHGNSDFVVPIAFAKQRYNTLTKSGLKVELRSEWAMGHFLSNSSLMATQGWMTEALQKSEAREKEQQQQQQQEQKQ